jgi:carboxyl-terminal processing protease
LQNEYTASASEVFIGALQDWDRAVVLGTTTYGKGLIQQSYKLGDGSNIRITIGRYTTPSGRALLRTRAEAEDVMLPYREALKANSLTSDLTLPDELITRSKSGRSIVAGDGGIVPDIHYIYEPEINAFQKDMNDAGLLYQFVTEYIHRERHNIMKQYTSVSGLMKDRMFEAFMLQELRKFLEQNRPFYNMPRNFPDPMIYQIKTWMASQLWHDNAYHEADNEDDRLLWRAREVMEGTMHDKLGIQYRK